MGGVEERLHTVTVGDDAAPAVVFLHGLLGQGTNFRTVARGLTPELRSVLVDLPDHGRSPRTGSFSYLAMADAVAAELRAASLVDDGPVHVVGHSLGGKVAMLLALRHPELVDHLVVVDIAPEAGDGTGQFEHLLDSLLGLDLAGIERRGDADSALAGAVPEEGMRAFLLQNLRQGDDGGWRWQADVAMLRAALGDIGGFPEVDAAFDGPTVWLAGAESDYIRPEHSGRMRELFPRVVKVSLKGAGHWVHAEQPQAFAATLRHFLL